MRKLRQPLVISALASILLILAGAGLWAETPSTRVPSLGPTSPVANTSSPQPSDSEALLPRIPPRRKEPMRLEGVAVDEMVAKVPSGTFHHDPDEYKSLYGFYGPFYNTTDLDGRVVVLEQTVYAWPTAKWKASGMVRNQTRQPVHINSVSAILRGPHGEVLDTVVTSIPVSNLRPGEPGPFVIESALLRSTVSTVEWRLDFELSPDKPRLLVFDIIDDRGSREGSLYDLFVTIRSEYDSKTRRARIVAAWLDDQERVIYVDSLKVRPTDDSATWRSWTYLAPNGTDDLIYSTTDPSLVSRIINARIVLWGMVE